MDSSFQPLCEIANCQLTRSVRSDLKQLFLIKGKSWHYGGSARIIMLMHDIVWILGTQHHIWLYMFRWSLRVSEYVFSPCWWLGHRRWETMPLEQNLFITTIRTCNLSIANHGKKTHQEILLVVNRRVLIVNFPKWFIIAFSHHESQWTWTSRQYGCMKWMKWCKNLYIYREIDQPNNYLSWLRWWRECGGGNGIGRRGNGDEGPGEPSSRKIQLGRCASVNRWVNLCCSTQGTLGLQIVALQCRPVLARACWVGYSLPCQNQRQHIHCQLFFSVACLTGARHSKCKSCQWLQHLMFLLFGLSACRSKLRLVSSQLYTRHPLQGDSY